MRSSENVQGNLVLRRSSGRVRASGVCVEDRWQELFQVTQPHTDDHVTLFNDFHFLMASLGAKELETAQRLLGGLQAAAA